MSVYSIQEKREHGYADVRVWIPTHISTIPEVRTGLDWPLLGRYMSRDQESDSNGLSNGHCTSVHRQGGGCGRWEIGHFGGICVSGCG